MKKIMAVMVALMFAFSMAFTSLALADGPMDKGMAPMSDKAKDGAGVSKDAPDHGKSHQAKMDSKKKKKKGKKGKKTKKSKKTS